MPNINTWLAQGGKSPLTLGLSLSQVHHLAASYDGKQKKLNTTQKALHVIGGWARDQDPSAEYTLGLKQVKRFWGLWRTAHITLTKESPSQQGLSVNG